LQRLVTRDARHNFVQAVDMRPRFARELTRDEDKPDKLSKGGI
jgi:hypothetical protein